VKALLVRTGLALAVVAGLVAAAPTAAADTPITDYHDVTVGGWMHIKDDERRRDDIGDHTLKKVVFRLIADAPRDGYSWEECQGEEVTVNFRLDVARISGRPGWIKVTTKGKLYEGAAGCYKNDREDVETLSFEMAPNTTVNKMMHLETRERRSDDYADVHFTVANFFDKL
jgi:hypothetical protein